jgi:hypothetical protein
MRAFWERVRCRRWRRLVSRGLDGRLRPGEDALAALSDHLLGCAPCRAYADGLEEDALRLRAWLAGLARPAWVAQVVPLGDPAPAPLPAWINRSLFASTLGLGMLAALVIASGPYALCFGTLPGVVPEPGDVLVGMLLVFTVFGGISLLMAREVMMRSLVRVGSWARVVRPAATATGSIFLASGIYILGMYYQLTCAVWGIS